MINYQCGRFCERNQIKICDYLREESCRGFVNDNVSSYEYRKDDPKNIFGPINNETGIRDKFSFIIDKNDRIISKIYSELLNDWYLSDCDGIDYDSVIEKRKEELKQMEQRGIELLHSLESKKYIKKAQ